MNEVAFKNKREADWHRLQYLSEKATNSPTQLTSEELQQYLRLHRRVSRDLSILRTQSTRAELVDYLNGLVGQVNCQVYQRKSRGLGESIVEAIQMSAQTFRRRFAFVVAAASIFFAGIFFAYIAMSLFPATRQYFVPPAMEPSFDSWKSGNLPTRSASDSLQAWGLYASNNPKVAAITAALGVATFGVGTVAMDWHNGVMTGALAKECATAGNLNFLIQSIIPHGVPEIGGLIIASSAGLVMGWALVAPGRRRRSESLKHAGKDAIVLMVTGICMMYIAAPIEGYFSFNPFIPGSLKVAVALVEIGFWYWFWTSVGNEAKKLVPKKWPSLFGAKAK